MNQSNRGLFEFLFMYSYVSQINNINHLMSYKAFRVEYLEEETIVKVTINRPKNLNAMNLDFFTEIN